VETSTFPKRFGPYVLLDLIGQGGMGELFLGAPLGDNRLCLIKTLKSLHLGDAEMRDRFLDEARVAVQLRHPNVCHVFEAGEADGQLFLAMEFVYGVTVLRLRSLVDGRGGALSPQTATALGVGLLAGLEAAHSAVDQSTGRALGVIHRDVSPQNAMVDVTGRVKVIDFGLAESTLKLVHTETNVVMGKIAYMAPEQARGEDVDATCDQFAAAVVLYELLARDRYYGDLPARGIWSAAGSGAFRPRAWDALPELLKPALARALAPDPQARFRTCAEFAYGLLEAMPSAGAVEMRQAIGNLVTSLQPEEIQRAHDAKALLDDLSPELRTATVEATASILVRASADVDTEPIPTLPGFDVGRSKKRSVARPVQRWRTPLLAVGAGLAIAAVLGVAGVSVLRSAEAPSSMALSASPAPKAAQPAQAPPPAVARALPPDEMKAAPAVKARASTSRAGTSKERARAQNAINELNRCNSKPPCVDEWRSAFDTRLKDARATDAQWQTIADNVEARCLPACGVPK
jgi:serine/threonine-protein kinase